MAAEPEAISNGKPKYVIPLWVRIASPLVSAAIFIWILSWTGSSAQEARDAGSDVKKVLWKSGGVVGGLLAGLITTVVAFIGFIILDIEFRRRWQRRKSDRAS